MKKRKTTSSDSTSSNSGKLLRMKSTTQFDSLILRKDPELTVTFYQVRFFYFFGLFCFRILSLRQGRKQLLCQHPKDLKLIKKSMMNLWEKEIIQRLMYNDHSFLWLSHNNLESLQGSKVKYCTRIHSWRHGCCSESEFYRLTL